MSQTENHPSLDPQFWLKRWEAKDIAFHLAEANAALVNNWPLERNFKRVFVPLCGKTLDIHWLLSKGCHVIGAELSQIAIEELFQELNISTTITQIGNLRRYSSINIDMYVGDIFELTAELLGPVDAIYDRAALIALPPDTRKQYTEHLRHITKTAPQLLVVIDYDHGAMNGPPFRVPNDEVLRHYDLYYNLTKLEVGSTVVRGPRTVDQTVWFLDTKN